jgi:hypothetical protein
LISNKLKEKMPIIYKEILSAVAILLTFIAFLPYIRSVLKDEIKPHVFSWIIWGSTTFIVFIAQLSDNGGIGAWPIGASGIITLYVALLAYHKRRDLSITLSDWIFLSLSMSSLPLWYFTSDPLWAVIILTFADILGFGPTFRKAYIFPFEEQLTFFVIMVVRNILSVFALENYSLTTILFPLAVALICLIFITMVLIRRYKLQAKFK